MYEKSEIETGVDLKRPDSAHTDHIGNAGFLSGLVQEPVQFVLAGGDNGKPDIVIVIPAIIMRDAGTGVDQLDKALYFLFRNPCAAKGADKAQFLWVKDRPDPADDAAFLELPDPVESLLLCDAGLLADPSIGFRVKRESSLNQV